METTSLKKIFLTTLLLLCCFVFSPAAWSQQLEISVRKTNYAPEILRAMITEKQQIIMNTLAEFAAQYKANGKSTNITENQKDTNSN